MRRHAVEFVDGKSETFDAIILATGYRSNVPLWLKVGTGSLFLFPFYFYPPIENQIAHM